MNKNVHVRFNNAPSKSCETTKKLSPEIISKFYGFWPQILFGCWFSNSYSILKANVGLVLEVTRRSLPKFQFMSHFSF